MIVVESSALVAIVLNEDDADEFEGLLIGKGCVLPASCLVEAATSLRRKGRSNAELDSYIARLRPALLPFDARQARIAVAADRRFGRATGHPAQLNFGDCMSYAAAIALDAPLLFKGGDFARTDVRRART